MDGAHHHDLPAGLAIADENGFAFSLGMERRYLLDEEGLGTADVFDRLSRHRLGHETDKIAGVPCAKHDADLAVVLHPADAGPVSGPRVEDNERSLSRIGLGVGRRHDPNETVIHRPLQRATAHDELELVAQDVWDLLAAVLQVIVAALAQHIQEEHGSLPGVDAIVQCLLRKLHARPRELVAEGARPTEFGPPFLQWIGSACLVGRDRFPFSCRRVGRSSAIPFICRAAAGAKEQSPWPPSRIDLTHGRPETSG